ncbi:MAG: hypothetical protein HY619_05190 [Thaumarchaeota archaeon]|nr:hypothetical protein [Nitrososphaerota archaeon]
MLGNGFQAGSLVHIQLDHSVDPKIAPILLGKIVANFVNNMHPVIIQPFAGIDASYLKTYMDTHLPSTATKGLVRMLVTSVNRGKQAEGPRTDVEGRLKSLQRILLDTKEEFTQKPLLAIMAGNIAPLTQDDNSLDLQRLKDFIRSNAHLSVLVTRPSTNGAPDPLAQAADVQLKVSEVSGTLLLQLDKPWSPLYAVVLSRQAGRPKIELHTIV